MSTSLNPMTLNRQNQVLDSPAVATEECPPPAPLRDHLVEEEVDKEAEISDYDIQQSIRDQPSIFDFAAPDFYSPPPMTHHLDYTAKAQLRQAELEFLRKQQLAKPKAQRLQTAKAPQDRDRQSFEEQQRIFAQEWRQEQQKAQEQLRSFQAKDKQVVFRGTPEKKKTKMQTSRTGEQLPPDSVAGSPVSQDTGPASVVVFPDSSERRTMQQTSSKRVYSIRTTRNPVARTQFLNTSFCQDDNDGAQSHNPPPRKISDSSADLEKAKDDFSEQGIGPIKMPVTSTKIKSKRSRATRLDQALSIVATVSQDDDDDDSLKQPDIVKQSHSSDSYPTKLPTPKSLGPIFLPTTGTKLRRKDSSFSSKSSSISTTCSSSAISPQNLDVPIALPTTASKKSKKRIEDAASSIHDVYPTRIPSLSMNISASPPCRSLPTVFIESSSNNIEEAKTSQASSTLDTGSADPKNSMTSIDDLNRMDESTPGATNAVTETISYSGITATDDPILVAISDGDMSSEPIHRHCGELPYASLVRKDANHLAKFLKDDEFLIVKGSATEWSDLLSDHEAYKAATKPFGENSEVLPVPQNLHTKSPNNLSVEGEQGCVVTEKKQDAHGAHEPTNDASSGYFHRPMRPAVAEHFQKLSRHLDKIASDADGGSSTTTTEILVEGNREELTERLEERENLHCHPDELDSSLNNSADTPCRQVTSEGAVLQRKDESTWSQQIQNCQTSNRLPEAEVPEGRLGGFGFSFFSSIATTTPGVSRPRYGMYL